MTPQRLSWWWAAAFLISALSHPHVLLAWGCTDPSTCGQWGSLNGLGVTHPQPAGDPVDPTNGARMQAIHSILLSNGRILCIDYIHASAPKTVLVDPVAGTIRYSGFPASDHNLFCAGHVSLADGRIFLRGGIGFPYGPYGATIYNPAGSPVGTWETSLVEHWDIPNYGDLPTYRFYPTVTVLSGGSALILDGFMGCAGNPAMFGDPNVPVIFHPDAASASSPWQPLYDAEYHPASANCDPDAYPGSNNCAGGAWNFALPWYPTAFLASQGTIFVAGYSDQPECANTDYSRSRRLNLGALTWEDAGAAPIHGQSAVMYRSDTIMKAGGPYYYTDNQVTQIRLSDPQPTWSPLPPAAGSVASMNNARVHFYLIALPDGKVLAVGGDRHGLVGPIDPVLEPEMYDPAANTWTVLAPMAVPRLYHSSAALLPTGAVFVGGGENCNAEVPGDCDDQRTYQIFKPPYFFDASGEIDRNWIKDCATPNAVNYGTTFLITLNPSLAGGDVTKVRLIRPGAATHSFDQSQRSMELSFSAPPSSTLCVPAPANGNEAPPGYYMLFVAKGTNGSLPSVAHWIRLIPAPTGNLAISIANPPAINPYAPGLPFRDVLQDTTTALVRQGIGDAATPDEGSYHYSTISVTFSAPTSLNVGDVSVGCNYTCVMNSACPTVTAVSGAGPGPYTITLSGSIPAGGRTEITLANIATSPALVYEFLPGDVNMNGLVTAQDYLALVTAINDGTAAFPANLARYDISAAGGSAVAETAMVSSPGRIPCGWRNCSMAPAPPKPGTA